METNLEIEFKTLLDKETYLKLKKQLFTNSSIKQVNDYFDTAQHELRKQHIMIRIRHFDDKADEFTMKIPQEDGVMEYSFSEDNLTINHPRIIDFMKDYHQDQLIKISSSTTYRSTFVDEYGEWALDHSFHGHIEDFELEYEIFNNVEAAKQHYLDFLNTYQIDYHKSTPKFLRSLKAFEAQLDELFGD